MGRCTGRKLRRLGLGLSPPSAHWTLVIGCCACRVGVGAGSSGWLLFFLLAGCEVGPQLGNRCVRHGVRSLDVQIAAGRTFLATPALALLSLQ